MKKILSCFSLTLCVILGTASLAACGNKTKWLRPNFAYTGDEFTVEFVNNAEKDFEFPVEGLKFDHSRFTGENILEYGWVIYNGDRELVGWIEAGNGYDVDKKGKYNYGFSPSTNNGVYGYSNTSFLVVFRSTDLSIFDRLEITSDLGSVAIITEVDPNPMSGTRRYSRYDEQTGDTLPSAGAENVVCCLYSLELESIDPKGPDTINITLSLRDE